MLQLPRQVIGPCKSTTIQRFVLSRLIILLLLLAPTMGYSESSYFTTSDKLRLHYETRGVGAPIVFVPGWSMPASIYEPQLTHFSKTHRVIAFDPRSQGQSDIAQTGHEPERRARDLHELLEHEKLNGVILVGWSLGVLDALAYTHYHGVSRVRALVLIDNSVGEGTPPKPGNLLKELAENRPLAVERFVRSMFHRPQSEAYYQALTASAMRTPYAVSVELLSYRRPREFWRDALYAADRPILYVVTPNFSGQARIVRRRGKQTETAVFSNAGHALFVDEPERFNRTVDRFLNHLPPTAP
jgi:microsomal epoxide hydrolase